MTTPPTSPDRRTIFALLTYWLLGGIFTAWFVARTPAQDVPQLIVVATVMLAIAPAAVAAGIKARRWRFGGQIAIALLVAGVLVLVPEFFFADVTAWVSVVLMCVGVVVIAFGLAVIDQPEQFS